ncbi:MAG TPA: hypothetical protein VN724_02170 [Pyrinomonadaceae bacterium]|nr:hypothetical protein [Pyrinomonadaceae bacterium]
MIAFYGTGRSHSSLRREEQDHENTGRHFDYWWSLTWYSCPVMINDHELGATEAVRLE